jgi:DNA-binding CsgD family transcriptional regulator/cell division protein FtsB
VRCRSVLEWVDNNSEADISATKDSLDKAYFLARSGDVKLKVRTLMYLSRFALNRLNNIEKCHAYLEDIKSMAEARNNDPWILSQYHNGRGVMFFHEQTNLKKAKSEFKIAQTLCERYSLPRDPQMLNNYALVYLSSDQASNALKLFKESARLAKSKKSALGKRFYISNTLNMGVCYIYLNDVESALNQFEKVVEIAEQTDGLDDDFEAFVYLGVFQEEQGMYEAAVASLSKAESILDFSKSYQMRSLLFESLQLLYEKKGVLAKAYDYSKKKQLYQDSLRDKRLSEQAFSLDYKFEAQKLRSEQIIKDLKNKADRQDFRWRILLLVLLLFAVVMAGVFVIYRLNQQKELNRVKAENEALEKEKISQQAEIDLLRKEEELISANVELNVRKNELTDLKNRLQNHLDKSHDPEFDDLKTFLKQANHSEKKMEQMKYLDHVLSYSNSTFYSNIRKQHPGLTEDELRLATLIRLNLSSEELLQVFNISMSSLMTKRYRMRKKLNLPKESSLEEYIMSV